VNSKPTAIHNGAFTNLKRVSVAAAALPAATTTVMAVVLPTDTIVPLAWNNAAPSIALATFSTTLYFDFWGAGANGRVNIATPGGWLSAAHLLEAGRQVDNTQFITVDGVQLAAAARTDVLSAGTFDFNSGSWPSVGWSYGNFSEIVVWAADLATNRSAARANITAYWLPPAFVGLLDVLGVTATRAYSTRRLRGGYTGSAIRIRRSSDNAEQDIGFVGENLDTAAITTFVGANSAFVVKWYDQSGSADDCVQATVASQARIVNAGTLDVRNGKACPFFDGTNDNYASVSSLGAFQTASTVAAINAATTFPDYNGISSTQTSNHLFVGTSGGTIFYTSLALTTVSVNNTGANAPVFGGTLMQVFGTALAGPINAGAEFIRLGNDLGLARYWPGWIGELVVFASTLSAGNQTAMYTNQKTYWGTP
jgi:hypothetical protein